VFVVSLSAGENAHVLAEQHATFLSSGNVKAYSPARTHNNVANVNAQSPKTGIYLLSSLPYEVAITRKAASRRCNIT
jgi:hypothetical protein